MLAHAEPGILVVTGMAAALALLQAQGHYTYVSGSKDWLAIKLSRGCRLSPCKGRRDNRCDRRPVAEISLRIHHLALSVRRTQRTTWRLDAQNPA